MDTMSRSCDGGSVIKQDVGWEANKRERKGDGEELKGTKGRSNEGRDGSHHAFPTLSTTKQITLSQMRVFYAPHIEQSVVRVAYDNTKTYKKCVCKTDEAVIVDGSNSGEGNRLVTVYVFQVLDFQV
ncbi:hypothetical protein BDN71DRAFT_1434497 [Pleurotus eryngii]|uniref:Uncharacterized protein n=1 Tax=Pleurotus eryngii TaxID=5323 RepID=A0A9P5ZMD1_PLEER|nr:hypothetical protein BDN71DRAFT_1434497 [Pleurotus eryngii]